MDELEWYSTMKKVEDSLRVRIAACDGRTDTDRQTDISRRHSPRRDATLCIASRGRPLKPKHSTVP